MNAQDREWLTRIDERTEVILSVLAGKENSMNGKLDEIIAHQIEQNGKILSNTIWRKVVVGGWSVSLAVIIGWLLKLTLGG